MKHTQGEWLPSKMVCDWSIFADDTEVASAYQYSRSIPEDEAKANAKLIAAAPELLEALDNLLDTMQEQLTEDHWENESIIQATKKAKAAIQKATN